MALKKDTETPFGVNANYWKIVSIETNLESNKLDVVLKAYVDDKARKNGAKALPVARKVSLGLNESQPQKQAILNVQEFLSQKDSALELIYKLIKEKNEFFKDAEDI